jgi:hypothetical protein
MHLSATPSGPMKYPITRFKNSKLALREIAQFVRSGEHLQIGKPLKRFSIHCAGV